MPARTDMTQPRTSPTRSAICCIGACVIAVASAAAAATADSDLFREGQAAPQVLSIGRMAQPPNLDGRLADWPADAAVIMLGQAADRVRRYGGWTGTRDLSGALRLAWSDEFLYLGADVCDDQLMQAAGPAEVWQGDTLEIFFNIHPREQRTDGFWQIALVPPLKPDATLRVTGPQKDFEGVEGTAQVRTNGYTLECRIPWRNLAGFKPTAGVYLGFQFFLDDRDGSGRKTQLVWYPSAITFSRPTHTGILILRAQGDTTAPRVLAGPTSWCVTDPQSMGLSAAADVEGASAATVSVIPPFPENVGRLPSPVTFALQKAGERLSQGQAAMPIEGLEGLFHFAVTAADERGRILAANTFQAQLVGARYAQVRALIESVSKRVEALQKRTDVDPEASAGLAAWLVRNRAYVGNEARPEALSRALLDRMLTELADLDKATAKLEAGADPYAGQKGSFVRAYRSPLTGQFRPYALLVPPSYDPTSATSMPLIVFLHSIFADERQLAMMADTFRDIGAIVYQGAAYRQFDWGGISAAETWAGLDSVKRHYHIDEDRVYLVGCHIGGRGVWQLAMGRPDLWAAAAPLFAGIDTRPAYAALRLYPQFYEQAISAQIPPPQFKPSPRPQPLTAPLERQLFEQASLAPRVENVLSLPLRSAFGEDDPDAAAERLALDQRFRELGAPLSTRYAPGAMHGSPAEELDDPRFSQWFLAHRRPPCPKRLTFVVPTLRYNSAWWVRIDGLTSPAGIGRMTAGVEGTNVTVTTENICALSLQLDQRVAEPGTRVAIQVDGTPCGSAVVGTNADGFSLVRDPTGPWHTGQVSAGLKRHGLSGPIDDFQFDRFLLVYGTGGDDKQKAALEALGKRMADWGLGAAFDVKADSDVSESDIRDAHLILIGTPQNHALLAKLADRLPLRWTASGLQLGASSVQGPGAGACLICPNPLAPDRYVVVVTAVDEAGYQVWNQRSPGGDYVLGHVATTEGQTGFAVTARGWFDNRWQWEADLCLESQAP